MSFLRFVFEKVLYEFAKHEDKPFRLVGVLNKYPFEYRLFVVKYQFTQLNEYVVDK